MCHSDCVWVWTSFHTCVATWNCFSVNCPFISLSQFSVVFITDLFVLYEFFVYYSYSPSVWSLNCQSSPAPQSSIYTDLVYGLFPNKSFSFYLVKYVSISFIASKFPILIKKLSPTTDFTCDAPILLLFFRILIYLEFTFAYEVREGCILFSLAGFICLFYLLVVILPPLFNT